MSALGAIIQLLTFFLTPFGLMSLMLGFLTFFLLPIVCKPFRVKFPVRFYTWLATMPISRAALVVSDHNDVTFKQMSFHALGVEKITLDGEEKDFEDPDRALHYWKGVPFALADEVHGMLFNPRHAAIGKKKHEANKRDEAFYLPTEDEWNQFSIQKWMRGVFEMPRAHELVDLSHVRELADGGERSEYGNRAEEYYKNSQDPFGRDASITEFLYPVMGFMIPFCGIWILSSQLGGGSLGIGETVAYGSAIHLLLVPVRLKRAGGWFKSKLPGRSNSDESDEDSDETADNDKSEPRSESDGSGGSKLPSLRTVGATLLWLLIIGGVEYGLFTVLGLTITVGMNIAAVFGFLAFPMLGFLSKPIPVVNGAMSKLFMRLGFMGYREPVFLWTPRKYVVKEFAHIERVGDVKWYNLFGTQVGFSYPPDPDSWDAEVVPHAELESMPIPEDHPDLSADGGQIKSNIPKKYVRTEAMNRDRYGGFIPRRIRDNKYYLHSGRALERFKHSANGEKTHLRLQEAKEKHGGGSDGLPDKGILYATTIMTALGALMGVWLFIA